MSPVLNTGVAIVGSGHAGYTLAREYRRIARDQPLVVLSQDDACSYSKPLLSTAFAARMTPAGLRTAEATQMQDRLKAVVMAGETVLAIDPVRRELALSSGLGVRYGQLVLALGAVPLTAPIGGDAASTVVFVNDLGGYSALRERMLEARRITIIGAGLVGCEFANDFALGGHRVDLVDLADRPLARLLPSLATTAIANALLAAGVHWHPSRSISMVAHRHLKTGGAAASRYTVTCSDGTLLESDLVVSAIGLRPRIELAEAAGLTVNRGIVVDRQLRTSDPNIYALGDCAEVDGQVLPYISPITHGARVLAAVLAGRDTVLDYPTMPIEVKTPGCPAMAVVPPAGVSGEWIAEIDEGFDTCALFRDSRGTLRGYSVTGRCLDRSAGLQQMLGTLVTSSH